MFKVNIGCDPHGNVSMAYSSYCNVLQENRCAYISSILSRDSCIAFACNCHKNRSLLYARLRHRWYMFQSHINAHCAFFLLRYMKHRHISQGIIWFMSQHWCMQMYHCQRLAAESIPQSQWWKVPIGLRLIPIFSLLWRQRSCRNFYWKYTFFHVIYHLAYFEISVLYCICLVSLKPNGCVPFNI